MENIDATKLVQLHKEMKARKKAEKALVEQQISSARPRSRVIAKRESKGPSKPVEYARAPSATGLQSTAGRPPATQRNSR
jgi:hypothetical protein